MNEKNHQTKADSAGEARSVQRGLEGKTAKLIYWTGVIMALFHLWVNTVGIMPEIQRNAVHFAFILFMGYLVYPWRKKAGDFSFKVDFGLAVLSVSRRRTWCCSRTRFTPVTRSPRR